ncbi:hypothetical protein QUA41_13365 [Microcoleus sp. Pol11C1]
MTVPSQIYQLTFHPNFTKRLALHCLIVRMDVEHGGNDGLGLKNWVF